MQGDMMLLMVGLSFLTLLFFFSSRRRHTRLVSDWSSDVCSSDLPTVTAAAYLCSFRIEPLAAGFATTHTYIGTREGRLRRHCGPLRTSPERNDVICETYTSAR